MIISLHLPKTAGTSFIKALQGHFGDALLSDYNDLPLNTLVYERNKGALTASIDIAESGDFLGIKCVHGHFLPIKYLLLSIRTDTKFITWLRDPIERLLSHYHYWQRSYDPMTAAKLHRRVVEEGWSLEHFCLSPELRNTYGQFLWGFPFEYFDFIGITEYYQEDLLWFSKNFLNTTLHAYSENVGQREEKKYPIDEGLRREIERFHAYDVELYGKALAIREKRLQNHKENDKYNG